MSDAGTVREIIERHNADLCQAFASGDIERYGQYFAGNCWQMNPGSEPLIGRAALVAGWRKQQELGQWAFDLQTQDVITNGPLAVERGVRDVVVHRWARHTAGNGLMDRESALLGSVATRG